MARAFHQRPCDFLIHAGQDDIQSSRQMVYTLYQAKVNLGVDREIARERDFFLSGDEFNRPDKAKRTNQPRITVPGWSQSLGYLEVTAQPAAGRRRCGTNLRRSHLWCELSQYRAPSRVWSFVISFIG